MEIAFRLLQISDFVYVGFKYENRNFLACTALHKRGKKLRVYYYLPNGRHYYHNSVPHLNSKKEKDSYLAEFTFALQQGYLPKKGAAELRSSSYDPKDGTFIIFFDNYFIRYSVGSRAKGSSALKFQRSVANRIITYFENLGITSISEISDKDITDWDQSLKLTQKIRGNGIISAATRNGWRKTFRAFLNTAKEKGYALRCDPSKMNIFEFSKGGEIDTTVDARKVIYPTELIEAVVQCSYPSSSSSTDDLSPDIKMIVLIWRELGLRPGEMFTLSEENFILHNGRPITLQIKKLNCPNGSAMEFSPKNFCSYRKLPLSDFAIHYFESLLKKLDGVKRYGYYKNELVEHPFLFVFWDKKEKKYIRDDYKFKKLFDAITNHAMNEFGLKYDDHFEVYDLRRSCNLYLKKVLCLEDIFAAKFLGHSVATNRKHYSLDGDNLQINQARIDAALRSSMNSSPEIARRYSYQTQYSPSGDADIASNLIYYPQRSTNNSTDSGETILRADSPEAASMKDELSSVIDRTISAVKNVVVSETVDKVRTNRGKKKAVLDCGEVQYLF